MSPTNVHSGHVVLSQTLHHMAQLGTNSSAMFSRYATNTLQYTSQLSVSLHIKRFGPNKRWTGFDVQDLRFPAPELPAIWIHLVILVILDSFGQSENTNVKWIQLGHLSEPRGKLSAHLRSSQVVNQCPKGPRAN